MGRERMRGHKAGRRVYLPSNMARLTSLDQVLEALGFDDALALAPRPPPAKQLDAPAPETTKVRASDAPAPGGGAGVGKPGQVRVGAVRLRESSQGGKGRGGGFYAAAKATVQRARGEATDGLEREGFVTAADAAIAMNRLKRLGVSGAGPGAGGRGEGLMAVLSEVGDCPPDTHMTCGRARASSSPVTRGAGQLPASYARSGRVTR